MASGLSTQRHSGCIGWLDKRGGPGKKKWQGTGRVSNGEGIVKGEGNKGIEHQKIICDQIIQPTNGVQS